MSWIPAWLVSCVQRLDALVWCGHVQLFTLFFGVLDVIARTVTLTVGVRRTGHLPRAIGGWRNSDPAWPQLQ
jgi:hypothetical protein